MDNRFRQFLFGSAAMAMLLVVMGLLITPIRERAYSKYMEWRADIKYAINPPEEAIFVPGNQVDLAVQKTMAAIAASHTTIPTLTATDIQSTPLPSFTPTITPTPLPDRVELKGIRYTDQHGMWNYCAPANLTMALSYWGWKGDRTDTGKVLKPYSTDKNVMPYEMQDFVLERTDLKAIIRVGGDQKMIKDFIAAGFPVLIETSEVLHGEFGPSEGWMGHYMVYNGYDDSARVFVGQDSLRGPDRETPYEGFDTAWRAFNYIYMVIYPPEKETDVLGILGDQADETSNYEYAALKAANEVEGLSGRDQFFAYFNRGTNLVALQDYGGAANAYDVAYSIYPSIAETDRPYRVMWYQTGPYYAYYFSQRYWDVINLATTTLDAMSEPMLEESYYWRARAELALGDRSGAYRDIRQALKYHAGFGPALQLQAEMGEQP
jgi:hypothetical protein